MANVTAREQLMLELVNRARMDPLGEAKRFNIDLNKGIPSDQTISSSPKQVLAMNDTLVEAARDHSAWMLSKDIFSHTGVGSSTPTERMKDAGYNFAGSYGSGENISWTGTTGTVDLDAAIVQQHKNLFLSPGHRENILRDSFREIGIGQKHGDFTVDRTTYDASMVTQDFAYSGSKLFVTGVVYEDEDGNDFYSIGEGQGSVVARSSTDNISDTTGSAGGYEMALGAGAKTFTLGDAALKFTLPDHNIKIDLVNGDEIWTNASLTLVSGVSEVHGLGVSKLSLTGSSAAESFYGTKAGDTLNGSGGNDKLYGNAGGDKLTGGDGSDTLRGGADKDTLTGSAGADKFDFNSASEVSSSASASKRDVITDFSHAQGDRIDFGDIDANRTTSVNDKFSFVSAERETFTGTKGQLIWHQETYDGKAVTIVEADTNGDKQADFELQLNGHIDLVSGDFIL